jgi:aspartate/methionine/tyrosine aminotransferase
MPTGQFALKNTFSRLIEFAQRHQILLIHDNPYSFILNDNPQSILKIPGAKSVALELNSLSKSHNMAGWRLGMLIGSSENIDAVLRFKSNMDSGMFLPLQLAAAKALELDENWSNSLNQIYSTRREKVFEFLSLLNCSYRLDQTGMFVWAAVPSNFKDGYELSDEILYKANVFITPGGIFGSNGNPFIRVSLCATEEKFKPQSIELNKYYEHCNYRDGVNRWINGFSLERKRICQTYYWS